MAPNARDSFLQNVAALLDNAPHRDDGAVLDAVMTALSWRGVAVGRAFFRDGAPPPRGAPVLIEGTKHYSSSKEDRGTDSTPLQHRPRNNSHDDMRAFQPFGGRQQRSPV